MFFLLQRCIMDNCRLLIDLCCNKIDEDNLAILDLLAMVLNPHSKYETNNTLSLKCVTVL